MRNSILDMTPARNIAANDIEPDMLIVHGPRAISVMPWDSLSAEFCDNCQRGGWKLVKEPDAWHLITPFHPSRRQ